MQLVAIALLAQQPPPTPVPSPTPVDPLAVAAPGVAPLADILRTYGLGVLLVVLLVGAALYLLSGAGEGVREAIKERWKRRTERVFAPSDEAEARSVREKAHVSGETAYLKWLTAQYGKIRPMGIGRKIALDLSRVHVPLRASGAHDFERAYRHAIGGGEGALDGETEPESQIFSPLSDQVLLARVIAEPERRARDRREQRSRLSRQIEEGTPAPRVTNRLLLLGMAGSGKTMTLRYAALCLADAYLRRDARALADALDLHLHQPLLPIYVRLTQFAEELPHDTRELPREERDEISGAAPEVFLDWLDRRAEQDCGVPIGTLRAAIEQRRVFLLLDGFDEAGTPQQRRYLASLISNLADAHPANRYLVASRPAGYGREMFLNGFRERYLSPLDADEAQAVIRNWFAAADYYLAEAGEERLRENAETQARKLWDDISRNDRLLDMARTPLLVTVMALLQYNQVHLPDRRVALYDELIKLLLNIWRDQQLNDVTIRKPLDQEELDRRRRALEDLALAMQRQPEQAREVMLEQAQEWLLPTPAFLGKPLAQATPAEEAAAKRGVAALLDELALDSGLIQKREPYYTFAHYTFQEYLAARALDGLDTPGQPPASIRLLLANSADQRWRETTLLATGNWSAGQNIAKARVLLEGLHGQHRHTGAPGPLLLAAAGLADAGYRSLSTLRDDLAADLQTLAFSDPPATPDATARNQAAVLLDRLDADARPELDPADPRYWATPIALGVFSLGDDNGRYDDEKPAIDYRIRQRYAVARFPVTNRQYAVFLDWLREHPAQHVRFGTPDERLPRTWPGSRFRPGEGSHPVTGVDWSGATAFAAWAIETWLTSEQRAAGEEIRLPSEPEWERAAAYPVTLPGGPTNTGRREYPWGAWDAEPPPDLLDELLAAQGDLTKTSNRSINAGIRANIRETKIGGTSAVGIFPHGAAACGAQDVAGNVWEWCSTPFLPYQDIRETGGVAPITLYNLSRKGAARTYVLRGGSWPYARVFARCACRHVGRPGRWYDLIGLRLARLFSLT
jgi:formylglycine-generating enzyme required for sulfatase activity